MKEVLYLLMAGGRGDRLRPLTERLPKPMIRFGASGRIIDFTLYNCLSSGGGRVVVLTQHLTSLLEEYLTEFWQPLFAQAGRSLQILPNHQTPKGHYEGTADAVYQALQLIPHLPERIVILAGDHIYHMNYHDMLRFHEQHSGGVTVAAVPCLPSQARNFGILHREPSGKIKSFLEKPLFWQKLCPDEELPLASMGIYVFTRDALWRFLKENQLHSSHDFGHDILPQMVAKEEAFAYPFLRPDGQIGYWRDVGNLFSYWRAHLELVDGSCHELYELMPLLISPPLSSVKWICQKEQGAQRIYRSLVARTASLGRSLIENSVLGPRVYVEDGVVLRNSVVLDGAVLRKWTYLDSAVVEPHTEVRPEWPPIFAPSSVPRNVPSAGRLHCFAS